MFVPMRESARTLQTGASSACRFGSLLVHDGRLRLSVVIATTTAGPEKLLVLSGVGIVDHDEGGKGKGRARGGEARSRGTVKAY